MYVITNHMNHFVSMFNAKSVTWSTEFADAQLFDSYDDAVTLINKNEKLFDNIKWNVVKDYGYDDEYTVQSNYQ